MSAFALPDRVDPELQMFLHEACSKLCKWLGNASEMSPLPLENSALPVALLDQDGASSDELLSQLQLIMDGAYQPSHPGAVAHLDPPPLTSCIAAELISAGLNNNLLAEELSPSLSRLERDLCGWFASQLGLPIDSTGVAASGGTLSNLMALVVARNHAGLNHDPTAVVVASADAHVSLVKATRVMGLHDDSLILVPTDNAGKISMIDLAIVIDQLKAEGRKCFALVATAGSTTRGAIDPLLDLSKLCSKEDIWFHVDGAIGGIFALSKNTKHLINGISHADSVTLNPQKVLGIPKTSSLLLVANSEHLKHTFSTGLPYMEPAFGVAHGGELGLQGSRSAEVLKLWIGLKQLGFNGINDLLNNAVERRIYLEERIDQNDFEILSGPLHLLSILPNGIKSEEASKWSASTRAMLLKNDLMLSRPFYNNRHYLKAVLGNPYTTFGHLDKLIGLLNRSLLN